MQQYPDTVLLMEFQKGNDRAFRQVFERYNKQLGYFAEKRIQDREEAEDIVAQTFSILWQKREDFETEEKIRSFLYVTTRNACIDFLRQRQRRQASGKELLYLEKDTDDVDLLKDIAESELLAIVYRAIENLPKKCKAVFKLVYLDGLSTSEGAARLRISERNVLNQKARAIKLLQRNLLILIGLYLCYHLN